MTKIKSFFKASKQWHLLLTMLFIIYLPCNSVLGSNSNLTESCEIEFGETFLLNAVCGDTIILNAVSCLPLINDTAFLSNLAGCDSLVITQYTLLPSNEIQMSATSCAPWEVGVDTIVLVNVNGCDSLVITTTSLTPTDTTFVNIPACDPLLVGNDTITFSGQTCDSLVILTSILMISDTTFFVNNSCTPMMNDTTFLVNEFGCDSVIINSFIPLNCDFLINGIAFLDENENGIYDPEEYFLNNQEINLDPDGLIIYSNSIGMSTFSIAPSQQYTMSINPSPLFNTVSNDSYTIDVGEEIIDSTFYFALSPIADFTVQSTDLSSSITRCDSDVNFWLSYTNEGTTINNGWVNLIPDESCIFQSADPMPDSIAVDGTLFWFYQDLFPFQTEQIQLVFTMPGGQEIGSILVFESNIQTNDGNGGYKHTFTSELICSYDPNDKLASPYGYGDENYTLFEDTLDYTIRFQNTGNDTAFNVIIRDTIDQNLNLNTFKFISSSHEVNTLIKTDSRIIEFHFNNILLVDSNANEPDSHGFVKYSIVANEGLNENTPITNTAGIYFDLNPPVVTNTVSNLMVSVLPELGSLETKEDELDFGTVALETTENLALTVINTGDLELNVNEIILQEEDGIFSFDFEPFTLNGGAELAIPVSFKPMMAQLYQNSITVKSDRGQDSIPLRGIGESDSGINEMDLLFEISPNPSSGIFNLKWNGKMPLQNAQLIVFDSSGKILIDKPYQASSNRIDLSVYSSGVYFIKLQNKEFTMIRKLLVE